LEVQLHIFFNLTLDGGECQPHNPNYFTPSERAPPQQTLNRKLAGHQTQSGHSWDILLAPSRFRTPTSFNPQPSHCIRLHHPGCWCCWRTFCI